MRQTQFLEGPDLVGNRTKYTADSFLLLKNIDSKTRKPFKSDREVKLAFYLKGLFLSWCEKGVRKLLRILDRQWFEAFDRHHLAVDPYLWRAINTKVQVGTTLMDHSCEKPGKRRLWVAGNTHNARLFLKRQPQTARLAQFEALIVISRF